MSFTQEQLAEAKELKDDELAQVAGGSVGPEVDRVIFRLKEISDGGGDPAVIEGVSTAIEYMYGLTTESYFKAYLKVKEMVSNFVDISEHPLMSSIWFTLEEIERIFFFEFGFVRDEYLPGC